jgi:replicative DNA helicase
VSLSPHEPRTEELAPHSTEAEEAVLGSILISADALFEVMGFLAPDAFFIVRHAWIFEAILALHKRRDPVDYLTIVSEMEQKNQLAEAGGAAYLLGLINKTPSALNVEGYGRIVERMATRRKLIEAAGKIARAAHSEETDIDAIVADAEQAVFDVTKQRTTGNTQTMQAMNSAHWDETERIMREGSLPGIPTGFSDLDALLAGLKQGDVIVIGGRPGMGKTSLGETIAEYNAARGRAVGFLSMEMSRHQLNNRTLAAYTGIPYQRLAMRKFKGDHEWSLYQEALSETGRWPYVIDDTPGLTPLQAETILQRMVWEHGIELAIIDYVQLMQNDGRKFSGKDNRVAEVTYISNCLKTTARKLNLPLIELAQLSRAVEQRADKRPQQSDLRESGSLEQDADVIIFPYREAYYTPDTLQGNKTELHIAKHRNGPTGMIDVIWLPEKMRYGNAVKEALDDM